MSIQIDHKSWKKDHSRWTATTRKFQADQKKLTRAVESLEKLLKQRTIELKKVMKNAKTEKTLMTGKKHTPAIHRSLKKTHVKHNRYYALQAKATKNLATLAKTIEDTIKGLH